VRRIAFDAAITGSTEEEFGASFDVSDPVEMDADPRTEHPSSNRTPKKKNSVKRHTAIKLHNKQQEMAPFVPVAIDERQSSTLRAITFRLQSTPLHQLPQISAHIAAQLVSCKQLLAASQDAVSKENGALLHSFKTRLSSLLQDRSVEGRWAAVVLLKSTIELGGSELLLNDKERCLGWIRSLMGILGKPDPSSTKTMTVVTLTRIFILTREHQTLTRELTTPNLPVFITACLNHFQGDKFANKPLQRVLLEPVLETFTHLVPRHPTVFRSFLAKIRTLVLQILSHSDYDSDGEIANYVSKHLRDVAQKLLVQLHLSAQKSGSAEEWGVSVRALVTSIHTTADQVFRATIEDWESVCDVRSTLEAGQTLPDQPFQDEPDQYGFSEWTGLSSGSDRMISLLGLLTKYISTPGSASAPLRTGLIVDLLARLMYMRVPLDKATGASRANNQVGRAEREELWSVLPSIHVATIEVFVALIQRVDVASSACNTQLLDLLPWLFESERSNVFLRTAVYKAVGVVLASLGPSLPKSSVLSLETIIQACCSDVLPAITSKEIDSSKAHLQSGSKSGQQGSNNAAATILSTTTVSISKSMEFPGLRDAAYRLLPIFLGKLPAQYIPVPARTELDRVAVLTKHPEALAASVLNPSPHKPSLLPLIATLCPESVEVEGILRPRMPVIRTGVSKDGGTNDFDEEDVSEPTVLHGTFDSAAKASSVDITKHTELNGAKTIQFTETVEVTQQQTTIEPTEVPIASSLIAAPVSTKRSQEEEPSLLSPTKRARWETESTRTVLPVTTILPDPSPSEPSTILVAQTDANMVDAGADDESDDGSDFEIPTLVMNGDESDDEVGEEQEDDE
jgi:pre-rRNA-processing protein RIX1